METNDSQIVCLPDRVNFVVLPSRDDCSQPVQSFKQSRAPRSSLPTAPCCGSCTVKLHGIRHMILDEVHERSIDELAARATVRQVSGHRKLPTPGKCDRRLVDPAGDPTEQRIAATSCITLERKDHKKRPRCGRHMSREPAMAGPGLPGPALVENSLGTAK